MLTRGSPEDPAVPHMVDSNGARDFFTQVFGKLYLEYLLKFEQCSCTSGAQFLPSFVRDLFLTSSRHPGQERPRQYSQADRKVDSRRLACVFLAQCRLLLC
jgi:hypothetical protein